MDNRHNSTNNPKRRLASILFADIKGYSKLMQRDESEALTLIKKFNAVLIDKVQSFQGTIQHFRGDGCMVTFDSVYQSVLFALAVQKEFSQGVIVPVRIGIHKGEVIFKGETAYGDSVNIAARIESVAEANSICVSKEVRDQIANQRIKMVSIGDYQLKNIDAPVEIFAIQSDFLAEVSQLSPPAQTHKKTAAITIGLFTLMALIIIVGAYLNKPRAQIYKSLQEKTVMVKVFENKTSESDLDNFGSFITDYVSTSLIKIHPFIINGSDEQQKVYMSSFVNSGNTQRSLQEGSADLIVEGRFYKEGDELILSSYLIDPTTNSTIHSFPQIRKNIDLKSDMASDLSQYIIGYWTIGDANLLKRKPPKYNAYKLFKQAMEAHTRRDTFVIIEDLKRALEIDSTFYDALFYLGHSYYVYKLYDDLDELVRTVSQSEYDFDNYETLKFEALKALHTGNLAQEAELYKRIAEINPYAANFRTAEALYKINKPQAALEYLQKELDLIQFRGSPHHQRVLNHKALCLDQLGRYEEIISMVDSVDFNITHSVLLIKYTQALSALGRVDDVAPLFEKFNSSDYIRKYPILIDFNCCYKLYMTEHEDARAFCRKVYDKYGETDKIYYLSLIARLLMMEGQYEPAIELLNRANTGDLNGELMYCYNKSGQNKKAKKIRKEQLKALENQDITLNSKALHNYALSSYHSSLEQYDVALSYIKEAHRLGLGFSWILYNNDMRLKDMKVYPPYQEFITPRS